MAVSTHSVKRPCVWGRVACICMHYLKKLAVTLASLSLANLAMTWDALHGILTPPHSSSLAWPGQQRACVPVQGAKGQAQHQSKFEQDAATTCNYNHHHHQPDLDQHGTVGVPDAATATVPLSLCASWFHLELSGVSPELLTN